MLAIDFSQDPIQCAPHLLHSNRAKKHHLRLGRDKKEVPSRRPNPSIEGKTVQRLHHAPAPGIGLALQSLTPQPKKVRPFRHQHRSHVNFLCNEASLLAHRRQALTLRSSPNLRQNTVQNGSLLVPFFDDLKFGKFIGKKIAWGLELLQMGSPASNRSTNTKGRAFSPMTFLATIGEGRRNLNFTKRQGIFTQGDTADAV